MRNKRELLFIVPVLLVAAGLISMTRPTLVKEHRRIKVKHDVFFLPPPKQLSVMSLGYRAALADVLWAHVLVSQGLHSLQKRRFENLLGLYDAVNELAPTWRTPYLFVDSLVTFQVSGIPPYNEVVRTREILERGTQNRPYDAEMWLNLGHFVSYIAPASYLEDTHPEVAAKWRREGVNYLARAAELGGSDSNISWMAMGATNILARAGETEALISFLKRTYEVTDDEALKQDILRKLRHLNDKRDQQAYEARDNTFRERVQGDLPFVTSRNLALALGPPFNPAACAGKQQDGANCATSWHDWSERFDASGAAYAAAQQDGSAEGASAKSAKSAKPAASAKPTGSAMPANSAKPAASAKPAGSAAPAHSAKPAGSAAKP